MEKLSGGSLLVGLAEVVAKQVEGNALPLLKPIDEAQDQLAVFGSAAAKADVDARLVLEELMDAKVRMERDAVYQQNDWLKHDLASERKRTLVYKEMYEASEEKIVELEEENERQKEEIRSKDEEICRLKAIIQYETDNPRHQTIVQGSQYNNQKYNCTETETKERKVGNGDIGIETAKNITTYTLQEDSPTEKRGVMCGYFEEEKAKNYRYKKSIFDLNEELKIGFRAKNNMPSFVNKIKKWNNDGVLLFKGSNIRDIFDEFIYCYYDEGELTKEEVNKKYETFKKACSGWNPK